MPKMMGQEASSMQGTLSGFEFSGTPVSKLGASEYSIANVFVDLSGSVQGWETKLEKAIKLIVGACRKSARSENLLFRVGAFNTSTWEIHGFVELMNINPNDYDNKFQAGGGTALFDAALNAVESSMEYAKELNDKDIFCNAVTYIITDGDENSSTIATIGNGGTPTSRAYKKIASAIEKIRKTEILESFQTILIGVADPNTQEGKRLEALLTEFKNGANLDELIMIGDLSEKTLAKLAGYVSQSFSSTSQALNTGGPSKPINQASVVPIDLNSI